MLYDQVEQAYTVAAANFPGHYATLLAAKGVTSPGTVTLIKRQSVVTALRYGKAPPLMGIVSLAGETQGRDQGKRHTRGLVAYDLYIKGSDPNLVAKQVELAAEALLRTIDMLPESGNGVFGAAEIPLSCKITLSDDEDEQVEDGQYGRRATISFPVWDKDEGV